MCDANLLLIPASPKAAFLLRFILELTHNAAKCISYIGGFNMNNRTDICELLALRPHAAARIAGSGEYPNIRGSVRFYQTALGVIVAAEIAGLPVSTERCGNRFFGFHIHSGEKCNGNDTDPFADALAHYNPTDCPHPHHAGDLPPLFGAGEYAFSVFLTDRFSVKDIIGKTVIIHSAPDDFTTQPAGNSGKKIACGQIKAD